jgi:hypothetical protein
VSSPTILDIQGGIKHALETIMDLRALGQEPDQPNFPLAYPRLVDWTYDQVFEMPGCEIGMLYHFDIWVAVSLGGQGLARAQAELNPYLSPGGSNSIKRALERDVSLGGCVQSTRVTDGGAYGRSEIAGIGCLLASVRVEIMA